MASTGEKGHYEKKEHSELQNCAYINKWLPWCKVPLSVRKRATQNVGSIIMNISFSEQNNKLWWPEKSLADSPVVFGKEGEELALSLWAATLSLSTTEEVRERDWLESSSSSGEGQWAHSV